MQCLVTIQLLFNLSKKKLGISNTQMNLKKAKLGQWKIRVLENEKTIRRRRVWGALDGFDFLALEVMTMEPMFLLAL